MYFRVDILVQGKSSVRDSVAIYGQLLLLCDQSMRETAWRSRARGRERRTLLAVRGRRASRSDMRAASQAFERMHIL